MRYGLTIKPDSPTHPRHNANAAIGAEISSQLIPNHWVGEYE
jgi:hypothetical protein